MIRNAVRTVVLAVALTGGSLAGADYGAGQDAWEAGRPAEGLGVLQDYVEAHKWFPLAASRGEVAAVKERDALTARMTPQQVAAAQEREAAWRPGLDQAAGLAESGEPVRSMAEAGGDSVARLWQAGTRFRDCAECPEMVVVPAGSFMMGSPESEAGRQDNEGPVHRVRIERPFAVGVYEVTRGEYSRFVSATGHGSGDSCVTLEGGEVEWRPGRHWRSPGFQQTDIHPVVCVSWDDARAYVLWLSEKTEKAYRLLSESEWEYVARGGTETARYWGESESGQCRYANGADASGDASTEHKKWHLLYRPGCNDGYVRTSPVGSFEGNGFGLHDVLGNVWEWVEDCWNGSYGGAPEDGSAWESGECDHRVVRGASWSHFPAALRSAYRNRDGAGFRIDYFGFRVARTLPL